MVRNTAKLAYDEVGAWMTADLRRQGRDRRREAIELQRSVAPAQAERGGTAHLS